MHAHQEADVAKGESRICYNLYMKMNKELVASIEGLDINRIPLERKQLLEELIDYVYLKQKDGMSVNLNFICTHNSRRSHLSQIWAQTMAAYYNINGVNCYSGGTEATAMYPVVAKTLIKQGFIIITLAEQENAVCAVRYDDVSPSIIAFSKKYDDRFNPQKSYGAIMTCASADEGCPVVFGSDVRIPIRYQDPKISDGTPRQAEVYLERSIQIATEMKYVFSKVKETPNS